MRPGWEAHGGHLEATLSRCKSQVAALQRRVEKHAELTELENLEPPPYRYSICDDAKARKAHNLCKGLGAGEKKKHRNGFKKIILCTFGRADTAAP